MAKPPQISPPFVWLGRYTEQITLLATLVAGALFRFYQLSSLPPGLTAGDANVGLQALNLVHHGWWPALNADNSYAPLWIWLQALAVKLFSNTELALRLWPAALGTLAILTTWLWARAWFGPRIAWITAFLLAVTPWAVTISRNAGPAALYPLLVTLTLWAATQLWRSRSARAGIIFAFTILLNLLSGPLGWLLAFTTLVVGAYITARTKSARKLGLPALVSGIGLAISLGILAYLAGISLTALRALPHDVGFVTNLSTIANGLVRTLLMFNVAGDENWTHNLSGYPMLNAFTGLMLVAGLLVGISRLHVRQYRLLFLFTIMLLLPAFLTASDPSSLPNAARAVADLPLILALCAIGISYMLELWYRTFPINSAARVTGQAAIIILLALTLLEGYTQYFKAWAGSSSVYTAYNEGPVAMATHLRAEQSRNVQRYVVAPADVLPVIAYLDYGDTGYTALEPAKINDLPVASTNRLFIIAAASRTSAVNNLKPKFPGGILRPEYSVFNQTEIYYTYEVSK
ncbi:MAG TPA: glycosyltransferase family 39 protein [Candidatus Saccharimonadia bacterium]|jgi:4-amino-4-deoxy-L-arabinose transferase-like glycosyltransferase